MVSAQDLELALLSTSLPSFHLFFLVGDIDDNGDIDHADDEYDGEDDNMTVMAMMMMAMMVMAMMLSTEETPATMGTTVMMRDTL